MSKATLDNLMISAPLTCFVFMVFVYCIKPFVAVWIDHMKAMYRVKVDNLRKEGEANVEMQRSISESVRELGSTIDVAIAEIRSSTESLKGSFVRLSERYGTFQDRLNQTLVQVADLAETGRAANNLSLHLIAKVDPRNTRWSEQDRLNFKRIASGKETNHAEDVGEGASGSSDVGSRP